MKCRQCLHPDTKVLESRESKDGLTVRRRRECPQCGTRFTTFERIEELPLFVLKRDGVREIFSREKLLRSMLVACQKRSVSMKDLERVVDWVERAAIASDEKELTSTKIGELVLDVLRHLDPVAYVRFASVYRAFASPEDFATELRRLENNAQLQILPQDIREQQKNLDEV